MATSAHYGLTQADFITQEGRTLYQMLQNYHLNPNTANAVIGPQAMKMMFPTFQILDDDPSMTTEALCYEVKQNRLRHVTRQVMQSTDKLLDADPISALATLSEGLETLRRFTSSKSTDIHGHEGVERALTKYYQRKQGISTAICSYPWEPLQKATGGIDVDDYIIFYGRPKSMKSWVLCALVAHVIQEGKNVLIYTKEMTADHVLTRIATVLAKVRYENFRAGNMTAQEEDMMRRVHDDMIERQNAGQRILCLSGKDTGEGGDTVTWLRSKIDEHQPHVCFIDGLYLMSDSRGGAKQKDNQRVQNISRDIRQMILETRVPVIGTIQANRDAAKNKEANTDEIAFSDAIGQDATLAMRTINEKDRPTIALVVAGSREFHLEGFRIFGIPSVNFGDAGSLTIAETIEAQKDDTKIADPLAQNVPIASPTQPKRGKGKTAANLPHVQATATQEPERTPTPPLVSAIVASPLAAVNGSLQPSQVDKLLSQVTELDLSVPPVLPIYGSQ